MKNLDSLTLKFFYEENKTFLNSGVIQKIQMPSRKEIIFYVRNQGENKKLYVNIDPKYPHIAFINDKEDYSVVIPKNPPMFCMQLRKYLEGAKILDTRLVEYDRIIELHFSVNDEFGILSNAVLAIELMGKYSNVILYNKKTGIITGSCHNVSENKSSVREVYGGIKYIYPPKQNKLDITRVSYAGFINNLSDIPNNFYYFSKPFFEFLNKKAKNNEELFNILQRAVLEPDFIKEFWNADGSFNEIILNYFKDIVNFDLIKSKKNKLEKIMNTKIRKLQNTLENKFDDKKFEKYKASGDLIFQYIYLIKEGDKVFEKDNLKVELDVTKTPSENAQKYYKLYSKLKSAKEVYLKRQDEAVELKKYYDEILFSIQNADKLFILDEIEDEINEFVLLKKSDKKEKPKLETINFNGFEIIIGKNNKQNDFLIRKLSSPEDVWLHANNCPSSHVIIKTQNGKIKLTDEVLLYAANLVKKYSPMKDTSKAGIIYTKRKYLKRPPDTHAGYVTYREEKEIIV